jgi:lysine 2,3-aminomutase
MLGEIRRRKAIYVLIHFNHPDELTDEVCLVLEDLTRAGMILLSQTVFLKGINDDKDTLLRLFQNLFYRGVTPYYIYRCDYVRGLERFVCDFGSERQIMTQITKELSGIAVPTYVVDVVGRGKIPVPLTFWDPVTLTSGTDFDGIQFSV